MVCTTEIYSAVFHFLVPGVCRPPLGGKTRAAPVRKRAASSSGKAASPCLPGSGPRYLDVISGSESVTPALVPDPAELARASRARCEQCVTSLE